MRTQKNGLEEGRTKRRLWQDCACWGICKMPKAIVLGLEGFKPTNQSNTNDMLATELSDLLYIIFILAEHYGINLEESFL